MDTQRKKRVRYTVDINFASEAEKDSFSIKLGEVRSKLTPRGSHSLSNKDLLLALFDLVGSTPTESTGAPQQEHQQCPPGGTFLRNSGLSIF